MAKEKISKETKEKLKGKETWITTYEGHEIMLVNKLKVTLYIDGVEAARQKGIISTNVTLTANIPDTDKTVIAMLYSTGKSDDVVINCSIVIGDQAEIIHGFQMKDGSFAPLTAEEEEQYIQIKKDRNEAADAAAIVSIL